MLQVLICIVLRGRLMSIPVYGLLAAINMALAKRVLSSTFSNFCNVVDGMAYIYAYTGSLSFYDSVQALFEAIIIAVSILVGNLLAVRQVNLKRILGYSSIAHFGCLLML